MSHSFSITFWGVRGSYPAPGALTARVGGNTPSLEVNAGKHRLILDPQRIHYWQGGVNFRWEIRDDDTSVWAGSAW